MAGTAGRPAMRPSLLLIVGAVLSCAVWPSASGKRAVDFSVLDFGAQDEAVPTSLGMLYSKQDPPPIKVFVYDESHFPTIKALTSKLGSTKFWKGTQWGTEVLMHIGFTGNLGAGVFTTTDPEEADFFFVPAYPKRYLFRYEKHANIEEKLEKEYIKLVQSMPYFQRSGGEDHIFVFPSGRGASAMLSWRTWMPNSIFMTPEAHYSDYQVQYAPYFTPHKDILIPGRISPSMAAMLVIHNKPMEERTQLSSYFGNPQGKRTRLALAQIAQDNPGKIQMDSVYDQAYAAAMTNSRFCLVPRGQSAWTIRSFEAIVAGCIPVFLSDHIKMPFEHWIDYSKFTIKWPEKALDGRFLKFLESIPVEKLEAAREYMVSIRCAYLYRTERPLSCNAFNVILKELAARRRDFKNSRYTYWKLGGEMMDKDLIPFEEWSGPMGGPDFFPSAPRFTPADPLPRG